MNANSKNEYLQSINTYLRAKEIPLLFEYMLNEVVTR